jgi:hypothetical protein
MTTPMTTAEFADPVPAQRLERAAAALTAHGFVHLLILNAELSPGRSTVLLLREAIGF